MSGLGLLIGKFHQFLTDLFAGKFHQFLTDLFALHMSIVSFPDDNLGKY